MLSHLAHPTRYLKSCTSDLNSRIHIPRSGAHLGKTAKRPDA